MNKLSSAAFLIIFLFLSVSTAQPNKIETAKRVEQTNKQAKPVEEYVKQVKAFVDKKGEPHKIIADVSDYNNSDKPIWKKFASEDALEKAREKEEAYTIAYIWKRNGKPVAVNFTYFSPSGDWVQYVYYVFYEDGSLAKVDRELRTFMNEIIVNRIHFYDRKGKLLKTTKNFRELSTGKIKKEPKSFIDIDVDIYKKVVDLPFARLLIDKKKPHKC